MPEKIGWTDNKTFDWSNLKFNIFDWLNIKIMIFSVLQVCLQLVQQRFLRIHLLALFLFSTRIQLL